ncbi:MAG: TatD family hydrolase [Candidatus Omnitrophica bacterium]|nr:TatD family hydrolase [Candidatus Omnitrophota bacterium]
MDIIDSHAHLDHLDNLEDALDAAYQAGVSAIMAPGVDLTANQKLLEIKKRIIAPKIYVGLGIHPGDIKTAEIDQTIDFIQQNIEEALAIGEIGLDFWYKWVRKDKEKKDEQRNVFQRQLEIAREHDLPVIIHSRGCWQECFDTTKTLGITKAVFHWYSGPVDVLDKILAAGYFVSATPSLACSPQAQDAIRHAPIEQTLIETDSPVYYKTEDGEGGFKSQPKDVLKTLSLYAGLKGMDSEKAVDILNNNARRLFGIV